MDKTIEKIISDIFEISTSQDYHFRTLYGFTFIFHERIMIINGSLSSAEIKPVGIIYEENDQYYLAPIDEAIEIEEVVKKFVEKNITQEEECFHFRQPPQQP